MNNCTGAIEYGSIIYYSHIIPIIISAVIIVFTFCKSKTTLVYRVFSFFVINFCIWLIFDTITWISTNYYLIIVFWTPLDLIDLISYTLGTYFFLILLNKKDIRTAYKVFLICILLPAIIITITGNSIIDFNDTTCEAINNNFLTKYKLLAQSILTSIIIWKFHKFLISERDCVKRKQVSIITYSLVTFFTVCSITEFISSETGIYEINLYSLLILPFFLLIMTFAIINYNIFNIKILGTQLLVYLVVITGSAGLFFTKNNLIVNIVSFITFISFSLLLLKTMTEENAVLNIIKSFHSSLSDKIANKTIEIKTAHSLEKKSRRELEKLNETKDQFVTIAQHNLRIPITNINNRLNAILSGKYGEINSELNKAIIETIPSIDNLTRIADDFRDIAKLKTGSQLLNIQTVNLKLLIENILQELKTDIEHMNITVTFPIDKSSWPDLKIDSNKIKEVLLIIIENAIRYNRQDGKIEIQTKVENEKNEIKIKNTGVGITKDEKENIFNHSFYRSKRAQEINPIGMGIGLSVSRNIIEAHHGTLSINSEGEGMGAEVILTLPLDFLNRKDLQIANE